MAVYVNSALSAWLAVLPVFWLILDYLPDWLFYIDA
jgi:hypothetical protein